MKPSVDPEESLKEFCTDFDKTIAQNGEHPNYDILEPVEGARHALMALKAHGWTITVFTARSDHFYKTICDYLNKYDIPYDRVICGKPFYKWYYDDRNLPYTGNWEDDVLKRI